MAKVKDIDLKTQLIEKGLKTEDEITMDGNKLVSPTRKEAIELLGTNEPEAYTINPVVIQKGYEAKIDNQIIRIHAPLKTRQGVVTRESFIEVQEGFDSKNGTPIMKTVDKLTELTDQQLWELAHAKVILLTPEQEKTFSAKFYPKENV